MSKTYVLYPNQKLSDGTVVDIVTTRWEQDRRWVVGERAKNGVISFYHKSYGTLGEVCYQKGLRVEDVKKRVINDGPKPEAPKIRVSRRKLSSAQRLALVTEVYDAAVTQSESFQDEKIGVDLAYLMGAISKGTCVDWKSEVCGDEPFLLGIFRNVFPVGHQVWSFVLL